MPQEGLITETCFTQFRESIEGIELPGQFTYPFFYEPHPLSFLAAKQLQNHLQHQTDWQHDFGIDHEVDGVNVGKMFGVLVVQKANQDIGFLSAFSGKLADQHHQPGFVPPVADYLAVDSFFRKGEKQIEAMTEELEKLLCSRAYIEAKSRYLDNQKQASQELEDSRKQLRSAKKARALQREEEKVQLDEQSYNQLLESLKEESMQMHYRDKDLQRHWKKILAEDKAFLAVFESQIKNLKDQRKQLSADLQQQLFDQYQFLNIDGKPRSVCNIFSETAFKVPPAGAGDCALPKLLQYAFQNQLKPLAMAEFWWGQSPNSEIRKHGYFYPSCKGKCEPILSHMLEGMAVDESPISKVTTTEKELEIVFEDEHLLLVNKPHDFLSVPGKTNADSVLSRMERQYPDATGPLLVHRLDRATSGLLLVAKTKEVHKHLQQQFLKKSIKKRYVALLDGELTENEGIVDLPLRPDIEDRPRQLVCFEHGKPARTRWQVVDQENGKTRVHLWPLTGRTHQLRMHAAHKDGLNMPIVGDDLYGQSDQRLFLQAAELTFVHPVTKEILNFRLEKDF